MPTLTILRGLRPTLATMLLVAAPTAFAMSCDTTPATSDETRTVDVRMENGDITVVVDGREIPADRIRRTDAGIVVLGEDGKPMPGIQINTPRPMPMDDGAIHDRHENVFIVKQDAAGAGRQVIEPGVGVGRPMMVFVGPDGTPQILESPGQGGSFAWVEQGDVPAQVRRWRVAEGEEGGEPQIRHMQVLIGPDGVPHMVGGMGDESEPTAMMLRATGTRPMLGIRMENVEKGVRIVDVLPDTPAAKAGLRTGDIIITAEEGVLTTDRLVGKLDGFKPGQTVSMWVLRGDEKQQFEVTLAAWPPEIAAGEMVGDLPFGPGMRIEIDDEQMSDEIRRVVRRIVGGEDGEAHMEVRVEVESSDEPHEGHGAVDAHRVLSVLREHLPELFVNGEVEVELEREGDGEFSLHIEVDRGGHDDDDDDHHEGEAHAEFHHEILRELQAAMDPDHLEAMHRGLEEMHREFEARWPQIERELERRLEGFAREWSREAEDFARERQEETERFARDLDGVMNERAREGEAFARRVGEALRRSEERNRMLEERITRLESMLERMTRRDATEAGRPAADPGSTDRPRRRGDRGSDAPRSDG